MYVKYILMSCKQGNQLAKLKYYTENTKKK